MGMMYYKREKGRDGRKSCSCEVLVCNTKAGFENDDEGFWVRDLQQRVMRQLSERTGIFRVSCTSTPVSNSAWSFVTASSLSSTSRAGVNEDSEPTNK